MKKFILLLLVMPATFSVVAQKTFTPFGKIDAADLRLASCSFDPGASAMKLFDIQEIEFEIDGYGAKLTTERRVRIKIFNEQGYKHASIRIPYYGKRKVTKIKDLSGAIYSLDSTGKVVVQKLEKKDFFKEKSEDNVRIINFTFPNLKPGSVIEFKYTKIEKNVLQIDPWIVQDKIPVAYASTILSTPSFSRIREKIYGADSIPQKIETVKRGALRLTKRTYYWENIVAFEPEPLMSSIKDNLLRVVFLLIPSSDFFTDVLTQPEVLWKFAGRSLLRSPLFGGQIRKMIPGTEGLIDSAWKITSASDRIHFIYDAVQKKIPDKTEQTLYPNDIVEAWNNRTGNTAEINLILLNLLKKAGIQSYPLLISTRSHGKINTKFPSSSQFNGVDVIAIDSTTIYLMDASLKYQLYQDPPMNVLNREAFLLDSADMRWVMVSDSRPLIKEQSSILGTISEKGEINGNATIFYYNYAKSNILDSTSKEDDDDDDFSDTKPLGLKIISEKQLYAENDSLPLERHIEFNYEMQNTGDFYFINPQFLSSSKNANPFIKDKRYTDIDFGCNHRMAFVLSLAVPPAYQIEQLPKSIIIRAPDSIFFYKRVVGGDSSRIYFSQVFEIQRAVFDKEEYDGVKEFFNRIFAVMAEEIILKKRK